MRPHTPTLLLIEDTRDHAELLGFAACRIRPGLDVRIADDGLDGIAYLAGLPPFEDRRANPRPDLVILDLYMPELSGFEVLEWIRDRPLPLRVPIVVLSARLTPEAERRCLDLGAAAAYQKPTDLEALGEVVREILESRIGARAMIGAHIWAAG